MEQIRVKKFSHTYRVTKFLKQVPLQLYGREITFSTKNPGKKQIFISTISYTKTVYK